MVVTLIDADGLAASVAIFREDGVKAVQAVRSRVSHDVALAAQHPVALETGKVTHVPARPSASVHSSARINCGIKIIF